MHNLFWSSHLKVKRAKKHINELNSLLLTFIHSDFYEVRIEHDAELRANFVCFDIDKSGFPLDDAALAIGDALHNLRSALDHLWFELVFTCGGEGTKWTRFPVRDAEDELVNAANSALEKQQITVQIRDFLLHTIKPHQGGNRAIWGLDEMNIRDKHEIFVPLLELMRFTEIRLEDDQQRPVGRAMYLMDESSRIRLNDAAGRITVKDKGKASATILFNIGTPFQGDAVIPTLSRIAEEVSRTIEAFALLLT